MMKQEAVSRRTALAVDFLNSLKRTKDEVSSAEFKVEEYSNIFINNYIENNKMQIAADVEKYRANIAEIQKLKGQLTEKMNTWYLFIKTSSNTSSLLFPVKFFIRKRKLCRELKRINSSIEKTTLENKLICENINEWENKKHEEAIEKLKGEEVYKNYRNIVKKKNNLIDELSFILPSIPGICPLSYSYESIDSLISKLSIKN